MSKICRTFAPKIETTMTKRTYIQPKMNVAVMPQYALMSFNNSPGEELNPAPKRRWKVF
jgi:hypothetical protein